MASASLAPLLQEGSTSSWSQTISSSTKLTIGTLSVDGGKTAPLQLFLIVTLISKLQAYLNHIVCFQTNN
jgi:hypothetical protein